METRHKTVIVVMVTLALIGAIVSFYWAQDSKSTRGWIAAAWTVLPPIWFWAEYTFLTKEDEKNDEKYRARLKFSQDCASKVWLAVGGIFSASYFDLLGKLAEH